MPSPSSLDAGAPEGAAINPATGLFTWTPNESQGGDVYSITVRVTDDSGLEASRSFAITVNEVNKAPTAADNTATTKQGNAVTIAVLANDTDSDGDLLQINSFTRPGCGAVIDTGNGTLTYTPASGFAGLDSFSYTISDGKGGQDTDAAGYGWFIDPTPADNLEFISHSAQAWMTGANSPASGKMDLLTAVTHELDHLLGFDHQDQGVMAPTLAPGVRHTTPAIGRSEAKKQVVLLFDEANGKLTPPVQDRLRTYLHSLKFDPALWQKPAASQDDREDEWIVDLGPKKRLT